MRKTEGKGQSQPRTGDIVGMQRQAEARDNDLVMPRIGQDITVKRDSHQRR